MPTATVRSKPAASSPKPRTSAKPTPKTLQAPDISAEEKQAITLFKRLVDLDTKRTEALKAFAVQACKIRRKMNDPAGTSQAYRDVMERVYSSANVPPDSQSTIQASIRYHIGNALREEFKPEELQAVGLSEKTPLEKAREARTPGATPPAEAGTTPPTTLAPVTPASDLAALVAAVAAEPAKPVHVELGALAVGTNPTPTGARKNERRDYTERPRVEVDMPDHVALVGHALDTVRSAASLKDIKPTEVPTLADMIRRLRLEIDRLEVRVAQAMPSKSSAGTRKAS